MSHVIRPDLDKNYLELEETGGSPPASQWRDAPRTDADTVAPLVNQLRATGHVMVENLLTADEVAEMRDATTALMGPRGRQEFEGFNTQRVYGVMAHTNALDPLVEHPLVLDVLDHFLQVNYLLSQVVAINIESGETEQHLHHDNLLYPIPRPRPPISVATMWSLTDFTETNGGTRFISGSHLWDGRLPDEDDVISHAEMPAGSVLFYLGTLWHGGGANRTDDGRIGVTVQYCQPWGRTVENFGLSMDLDRVRRCSDEMQSMLGFNIHSNLMGYVDGRHPARLLSD